MSEPGLGSTSEPAESSSTSAVGRIGVDWWATIVAGVIAILAAVDVLPKIPW